MEEGQSLENIYLNAHYNQNPNSNEMVSTLTLRTFMHQVRLCVVLINALIKCT